MRIIPMAVLGAAMMFVGWFFGGSKDQGMVGRAERDEVVLVAKDDPEMAAARNKARDTLPEFFAAARQPAPAMRVFSLQVMVRDGDAVEYFWIRDFAANGNRFSGKIDNTPRTVRNVTAGQVIEFSENEIFDWMYMDGARMKGNYSACVLLAREPKDQQEAAKKRFGLTCDA